MNQLYEIYWVKFIKEESKEKEKNNEPLTQDDFTHRLALVLKPGTIVTISKITTVERRGRGEYKIQDWRAANLLAPSYVRLTKQESNVKESRLLSLQGRLNEKDSLAID